MGLVMKGAHGALLRTSHKSHEAICDADRAGTGKKVILISVLHYDNLCRTVECIFANIDRIILLPQR